jgi:hypothetical protein
MGISKSCLNYIANGITNRYLDRKTNSNIPASRENIFIIVSSLQDVCKREYIVTYLGVCDYRRRMDWRIRFVDHLYTPFGTTIYNLLTPILSSNLLQSTLAVF